MTRDSLLWRAVLAIVAVGALVIATLGRQLPAEHVIDLQFPLRGGVYYVVAGGSVELLNPHLMTLTEDRFRAYRGQSYGIDLLKLGAYGTRASGLLPADPAQYSIYGDAVYAPCAGRVVQVRDGAPDMSPPQPDRTRMAGNHVLLDRDGVHVLLAHLQLGTVRPRRSEWGSTLGPSSASSATPGTATNHICIFTRSAPRLQGTSRSAAIRCRCGSTGGTSSAMTVSPA